MSMFEWDAAKASTNREKHGISFQDAARVFSEPHLTARSKFDAEARFVSVGAVEGVVIAVVWTPRGADVKRIISARKARREEARQYRQSLGIEP